MQIANAFRTRPTSTLRPNVRNLTPGQGVDRWDGGLGRQVPSKIRDAQYWLDRAEEAQLQAEEMTYADSRREMLKVAAAYRLLAKLAQAGSTAKKQPASGPQL
jgi:hypothetical protein